MIKYPILIINAVLKRNITDIKKLFFLRILAIGMRII
jgi:hypothetical protein